MSQPEPGAVPARCRPWVLAATILGSSMAFINGSVVNVALPAMQESLSATVVDLQWMLNAYNLLLSSLLLLGGALGDRSRAVHRAFLPVFRAICVACAGLCALAAACGGLWVRRPRLNEGGLPGGA